MKTASWVILVVAGALILVATSAGPVSVQIANISTDADLREHFRSVWPRFFAGPDKHWPLFETLQFSADAYTAAFTRAMIFETRSLGSTCRPC